MKFKVGDIVMLSTDSYYYNQAPGVVGELIVVHPGPREFVRIKWNQVPSETRPLEDNYPMIDLIPYTRLSKLLREGSNEI